MAKYRNKKTGAILETECKISGGNWEEVVTKKTSKKSDKKKSDEQLETNEGSANEDETQFEDSEDE